MTFTRTLLMPLLLSFASLASAADGLIAIKSPHTDRKSVV